MGFHVCFIRYKDMICIGDIRARWIYGLKTFKVGCLFYILIVSQRNMYLIMRWLYNTWWKSFAHHDCKSNTNQILQQFFTANSWFLEQPFPYTRHWFQWPCDRPISHWWHRGLAVEFDMYRNPDLGELSGNHISVHVPPRKGGTVREEMFGMSS